MANAESRNDFMKLFLAIVVFGYLMLLSPVWALSSFTVNPFTIRLVAPSTALPGEVITFFVESAFNGTYVNAVFEGVYLWYTDGGRVRYMLLPQYPTLFATGRYYASYHIPENATGVNWIQVKGNYHGFNATGDAGVTMVHSNVNVQAPHNQTNNLTDMVNLMSERLKTLEYEVRTMMYVIYGALTVLVALNVCLIVFSLRKKS